MPSRTLNWNRAATCAAPAPGVAEAMIEGLYALPGDRGAGKSSSTERIFAIRAKAATLFGLHSPERVLFTPGATFGLNVAVHCGIPNHTKVLTTSFEHNSLLRPLHAARQRDVTMTVLPSTCHGQLDLQELQIALNSGEYSTLAMSIASNTLGVIQPYEEACRLAREAGVSVILDLAQGGGILPLHLESLDVAYASIAGHKSLHGPRGIGLLFVGASQNPKPFLHGGTGSFSNQLTMPDDLPSHLEAGTSNYPGIYGLGAALDYLAENPPQLTGIRALLEEMEAWCRHQEGLEVLPSSGLDWQQRLPILALRHSTIPAEMLAEYLAVAGVLVRAGSMCAALALPQLGISDSILRLSPPLESSRADFDFVREILSEAFAALA